MHHVTPALSVQSAFNYCEQIAKRHYENFPVASLFIRKKYRPYIYSIYAFARTADDFSDEGTLSAAKRLEKLDRWEEQLDECIAGRAIQPIFVALAETLARTGIPRKPLSDLLVAFRMDVTQDRFETFDELLNYCAHSANPIGQLVLYVFHAAADSTISLSDKICTALQLANFWQDVSVDLKKPRVYIPLEDFDRFGYTEADLLRRTSDERFRRLMQFEVERTEDLFSEGRPLLDLVPGELRFELRLTLHAGMTILRKIRAAQYDVITRRPRITSVDRASILAKSILQR